MTGRHAKGPAGEMASSAFVLEPLAEIAPYAYHPGYHKTIIELLEILQKQKRLNYNIRKTIFKGAANDMRMPFAIVTGSI